MIEPKPHGRINHQVAAWHCPVKECGGRLTVFVHRKAERFVCRACNRAWESLAFCEALEDAKERRAAERAGEDYDG